MVLFERMLVRSGIQLTKYWFSISDEEQHLRFLGRIPYTEVAHASIELPPRVRHDDYVRHPVPAEIMVPERY